MTKLVSLLGLQTADKTVLQKFFDSVGFYEVREFKKDFTLSEAYRDVLFSYFGVNQKKETLHRIASRTGRSFNRVQWMKNSAVKQILPRAKNPY